MASAICLLLPIPKHRMGAVGHAFRQVWKMGFVVRVV
jgi:hypothetical protein